MEKTPDLPARAITSVSSGGESISVDNGAIKAQDRYEQNNDLRNIACRRVRPTFGRILFRGIY